MSGNILLVEDDDIDAEAVLRAFRKDGDDVSVTVALDGIEALQILRGEHTEKVMSGPFIMFVDINMPRMNGHELLSEIRRDPVLANLVVFVLTTSNAPKDIEMAYEKQAAGYIVKNQIGDNYQQLVSFVQHYFACMRLSA